MVSPQFVDYLNNNELLIVNFRYIGIDDYNKEAFASTKIG